MFYFFNVFLNFIVHLSALKNKKLKEFQMNIKLSTIATTENIYFEKQWRTIETK